MNVLRVGSKITSLSLPSPLSRFTEQNHVKTTEEKVAKLQLVMFLETPVRHSALNQALMLGNGNRIRQDGQWLSLGPRPVQPYSAWPVVAVGS